MKFDARYNRLENQDGAWDSDNFGNKAWADELTYGIIEAGDWDEAVQLIVDQAVDYDYGRDNLPARYAGKIYLIDQDSKEVRVYSDNEILLAHFSGSEWHFEDDWKEHHWQMRKELGLRMSIDPVQFEKDSLKEVQAQSK